MASKYEADLNSDVAYLKKIVPIMKKLGVAKFNGIELATESYSEMLGSLKELLPSLMHAGLGSLHDTPKSTAPPTKGAKKVIPIFGGLNLTPTPRHGRRKSK